MGYRGFRDFFMNINIHLHLVCASLSLPEKKHPSMIYTLELSTDIEKISSNNETP